MAHTLHTCLRLLGLCLPLAGCVTLDSVLRPGDTAQTQQNATWQQLAVTPCDRAASSSEDPNAPAGVNPVDWEQLDAQVAVTACQQALAEHPGHPRLLSLLSRAHLKAKRERESYEFMQAAAKQNYPYALYSLGWHYESGAGTPVQFDAAIAAYAEAGQLGIPRAWNRIGIVYADKRQPHDLNRAIDSFRKAAEAGEVYAMANLAAYLQNRGRSRDLDESLAWARRAAERGNANGMRMVAYHYWKQKEFALALPWYQRAAEAGDAASLYTLGHYYLLGTGGVRRDTPVAIAHYERSARAGYQPAALELAELYAKGREVPVDRSESLKWLTYGMPKLSVRPQPAAARP